MGRLVVRPIKEVWDEARGGIATALSKAGSDDIPEDIYALCVTGRAVCYVDEDDHTTSLVMQDTPEGAVILTAYCASGDALRRFQPEVDEIVREAGYSRMFFYSSRSAWDRVPGWSAGQTKYIREV